LPNGKKITYIVDANNHRVGKAVNGSLTTGFLYDGDRIVAQLNGSNAIVSQFVYASQTQTPDYMVSGGVIYRIFSDQLGSPRLVLNTTNGAIAEQIDNDEFGNVISDTNPGFQLFGFAGGLYDQDTKLVRFGARDYNPAVGRWTAKDPILFAGGDTNLYGYVLNDPVNSWDASGLAPSWVNDILNWFQNLNQPMQFGNGVDDVQQSAQQFLDNLVQDGAEVPTNVTSTGCKTSFGPGGYGGWGGGLGTALLFVNTGLLQQLLQQGAPWQACPNHNCAL